jgi:hypothetical protein
LSQQLKLIQPVMNAAIRAGGQQLSWTEADLAARSKSDPRKLAIAALLRAERRFL